ncbi:MAG: hypothetical protein AAFW73_22265 [Bacteroidota bacterium]
MTTTRKFPRWLAWVLGILVVLLVALGAFLYTQNEPRPQGQTGPDAEALADKMLAAIDAAAWDTTGVIQWTFKGVHQYLWDRERHLTQVLWDDTEVLLDLSKIEGRVWIAGTEVYQDTAQTAVQKAWSYWCNDSFWLNAPAKCRDEGTTRATVDLEDGQRGLLVTYRSGGVTPGDAYLWILDETGLPTSYKMWVSIIKIGGLEFTWEDWTQLPTGAQIAQLHRGPIDLDMSNIRAAHKLSDLGLEEDPFAPLLE